MPDALLKSLLSGLRRPAQAGFNVFDVMRHGTHEKQISNVLGWLLDADGSHRLGDLFQQVFTGVGGANMLGSMDIRFDLSGYIRKPGGQA